MLRIFFVRHVDDGIEVEVGKIGDLGLMNCENVRLSDDIGVNKLEGSIQVWKNWLNFRELGQALTWFDHNFKDSEAVFVGLFILFFESKKVSKESAYFRHFDLLVGKCNRLNTFAFEYYVAVDLLGQEGREFDLFLEGDIDPWFFRNRVDIRGPDLLVYSVHIHCQQYFVGIYLYPVNFFYFTADGLQQFLVYIDCFFLVSATAVDGKIEVIVGGGNAKSGLDIFVIVCIFAGNNCL